MKVVLIGDKGNMGRRYQSILYSMGVDVYGFDNDYSYIALQRAIQKSKKVIVATPTPSHEGMICLLASLATDFDLLCEKPICKTPAMRLLYPICDNARVNLYCVNQYCYLEEYEEFKDKKGHSYYDYYNSGKDGAIWDCFQIWALANSTVGIGTDSPLWQCGINGIDIAPGQMDEAYISMIDDFLHTKEKMWDRKKILKTTERILNAQSPHRGSGQNPFPAA